MTIEEYYEKYFENFNSVAAADADEHVMTGEDTIMYSRLEFKDCFSSREYEEIMELRRQEDALLQQAFDTLWGHYGIEI
jgi:hypothetical protein